MKRIVGGREARLVLLATATALPLAAVPVQAAPAPPERAVRFEYSDPEFAETGTQVTWRWTVRNTGDRPVDGVKLVHTFTPRLKVTSVSPPCQARANTVTCDYAKLRAGGVKRGMLVADLPQDSSGTIEIKGRVTWRQAQAPATDTASPTTPPPDQGATGNGNATGGTPPEREEGPEPRPNGNVLPLPNDAKEGR